MAEEFPSFGTTLLTKEEEQEESALQRIRGTDFERLSTVPGYTFATGERFVKDLSPQVLQGARRWLRKEDSQWLRFEEANPHVLERADDRARLGDNPNGHIALSADGKNNH